MSRSGKTILLLRGDGVGAELQVHALKILQRLQELGLDVGLECADIGGRAIDSVGDAFPDETRAAVLRADAVFLGAVGGPRWDHLEIDRRPESALLELRRCMGTFANIRPLVAHPELIEQSPLKKERLQGMDILIVRELIGGIYFGSPRGEGERNGRRYAWNTMVYDETEIERIARVALKAAVDRKRRLCSIDKANVLEVSRLWRRVVARCALDYPAVEVSHQYIDNAAMQMALEPTQFDVVLTSNLFGDILSDLGAAVVGSIGLLPSASLNDSAVGLYEPIHGSAPDLVGTDSVNPIATIKSIAMMLRHSALSIEWAQKLDDAIVEVIAAGYRTADIYTEGTRKVSTSQMVDRICVRL